MKNSFEYSLLETGENIKRGYSVLLQNAGKTVAIITGIVAVLTTFTEIGFCDFDPKRLTSTALMMLVSSYLIFFSLVEAGEKLGKECEFYINAESCYLKKRESVSGEDIPALRNFCKDYAAEELKHRREMKLCACGYSYSEYLEYKEGVNQDKIKVRTFKKIDKLKPLPLSIQDILTSGKRRSSPEFKNPEKWRNTKLVFKLLPSTLCMLFTISIMLSAKEGLTFAVVMDSLIKLAALPIIGLKGYSSGYSYVKNDTVFWLETKTRLLEAFLRSK